MSNYIYTIDENEAEVLARYEGILAQKKDPHRYDTLPKDALALRAEPRTRATTYLSDVMRPLGRLLISSQGKSALTLTHQVCHYTTQILTARPQ